MRGASDYFLHLFETVGNTYTQAEHLTLTKVDLVMRSLWYPELPGSYYEVMLEEVLTRVDSILNSGSV